MKVYHTSNIEIQTPDVAHSRRYLDFGKGFYVTPLEEQALKYGARFKVRGMIPIINEYDFSLDTTKFKYKKFASYDEEWLDFVAANRDGMMVEDYDVIEGGVANDKVFDTIDLYFSGRMSKTDALQKLAYLKPNWQICIRTNEAIQNSLKFVTSRKLD
ncbi:MAG: DUF3990 domain-containing protein [Bacteroidales bacterium]|nr:DUF3990 domain-containing protein [Bacteroidales bacterium]